MVPHQESSESTTGNENENVRERLSRRELAHQRTLQKHEDDLKVLKTLLGILPSDHLSCLFFGAPASAGTVGELSKEILRYVVYWAILRHEMEDKFSAASFREELNEFEQSTDKFKPWDPYGSGSSGRCKGFTAIKGKFETVKAEMTEKMIAKGFNGAFMVKDAIRQFWKKQGLNQSAGRKRKRDEEDNEDGDEVQTKTRLTTEQQKEIPSVSASPAPSSTSDAMSTATTLSRLTTTSNTELIELINQKNDDELRDFDSRYQAYRLGRGFRG